jgi:type VI secretion system Hcp family effector
MAAAALPFRPSSPAGARTNSADDTRAYASFKCAKQGLIKAPNSKDGREADGWFLIKSFSFDLPTNIHPKPSPNGGKRQAVPQPLLIIKQMDASSPKLLEALNTNEKLEVVLQTVDKDNKVIQTTTVKDANVTGIRKENGEWVYFEYMEKATKP